MKWISVLSEAKTLPDALLDVTQKLHAALHGQRPDLCMVFVSSDFLSGYESIPPHLQNEFHPRVLLGCSGGGVIGDGREVEHHSGLSITVAVLPGVELTPFRVADGSLPGLDSSPRLWHELAGIAPSENPQFILLADPFSIRTENLLMGLDYAYPKAVKMGGLASGATQPGENAIFLDSVCYRSGAVGLALSGNIVMDAVVAQGCRPIGRPFRVTQCDRNILMKLDGETPLKILRDLFLTLNDRDQNLLQNALFLGLVMNPMKTHFTQGDFLIRNIVGLDADKGILAVGALLREGQMVQFHLRDAQTSAEDLNHALAEYQNRPTGGQVAGAILFSCLGRGEYLYGHASHDTHLFQKKLGSVPISGFFCNGEIGPVDGTTYLHGYTSCFALVRPMFVPPSDVLSPAKNAIQPAQHPPRT